MKERRIETNNWALLMQQCVCSVQSHCMAPAWSNSYASLAKIYIESSCHAIIEHKGRHIVRKDTLGPLENIPIELLVWWFASRLQKSVEKEFPAGWPRSIVECAYSFTSRPRSEREQETPDSNISKEPLTRGKLVAVMRPINLASFISILRFGCYSWQWALAAL